MAKIERVLMDAEINPTPDEVNSGWPGLTIQSRPTTSSLSDYDQFDLRLISRGEFSAVLTDGAVS